MPQGHKVALSDIAEGAAVRRYDVAIGFALAPIAAGRWVHEKLLRMPDARGLDNLPIADAPRRKLEPLEGFTFQGFRNPDGSVVSATRGAEDSLR